MMKTVLCALGLFVLLLGSGAASVATAEELPDLVVTAITRDGPYYVATYCNVGSASSDSTFTFLFHNKMTGRSFQTSTLYPYSVPEPGQCRQTGGLTCGLISNNCQDPARIVVLVDNTNQVVESNEKNNGRSVCFCP